MITLNSKKELDEAIATENFSLFYLSREECGVCKSLKPKVRMVADKYPNLKQYFVDLNSDETIAGQYSIFTIPAILVYAEGKESIREARYISIDEFESKIDRLSSML